MKLLSSFALLSLLGLLKADQPVHCPREKVVGSWNFYISTETQNVDIWNAKEVCTHKLPNRIQLIEKDHKFHFMG